MIAAAHVDARCVAAVGGPEAVAALERTLLDGFDPARDLRRVSVPLSAGELLLMPSQTPEWTGVKLITVAPSNVERGAPRIQGVYVLFDTSTLTPVVTTDGAALTSLRTPAVSMLAIRRQLQRASRPQHVVIAGTGPQAVRHAQAIAEFAAIADVELADVALLSRSPREVATDGVDSRVVAYADAAPLLSGAQIIVCTTTARTPIFDGALVQDGAMVVAVGSHEPTARELDANLMGRAQVFVEDRATALREAGDVVLAVAEGTLTADMLVPIGDLVRGAVPLATDRPVVFKTVGMSWQDLAIARLIVERGA
ncbi:MAG: ornithine cyclodeaminase family protein [Microbacterium sp.]